MFISRIIVVFALFTLGACASSPRYVAADSADGYGHYSRKIAENRYRVNFNGSRRANLQETRDFALLRAAELTVSKGYDWFQVVDRESATIEAREPRTGIGVERAWYVERDCGLLGCSRSVDPATYTQMTVDSGRPVEKHSYSLEIVMGTGEVPEDGNYYDAEEVMETIYSSM